MNSEKVKEIKKALEQNDYNGILYVVNNQKRTCKIIYHKDILTLINELESENKSLQELCNKTYEDLTKEIDRLESENERLRKERDKYIVENKDIEESNTYANKFLEKNKEENKQLKDRIAELENGIAKSMLGCEFLPECTNEKLKQFAERLKEKFYYVFGSEQEQSVSGFDTKILIEYIYETLKEFVGGVEE